MNVRLTEEQKIKVLNSADIFKVMQQVLLREKKIDRNKEHLWVVCLASNNQILMIELISLGTVNETLVTPMEIFSFALQKRAVKILMVHNHPSGELTLSLSDYAITEKMYSIGKFLKLPVIDHLVISEKEYFSFKDAGLLDKMELDNNFDLTFAKHEQFHRDIKELEKKTKEEKKKREVEIAKQLISDGVPVELIMKATGLTMKQIEKLRS